MGMIIYTSILRSITFVCDFVADMDEIELREHSTLPPENPQEGGTMALQVANGKTVCYTKMPVHQSMKPLLFTCAIGGLVFTTNFAVTGIRRHLTASRMYSFLLLLFYITNVTRYYTMFDDKESFGVMLFMKMTHCVWSLETLGHFVASVTACLDYKRLPEYFVEWEKIRRDCSLPLDSIEKYARLSATVLNVLLSINATFATYLIFGTNVQDVYLTPWDREFEYVVLIQTINAVQHFYCTLSWFGPSVLMFVICKILAYEFNAVQHRIERLVQGREVSGEETLERLRRLHQNLCNLVSHADGIFSMQIALSFCGSLTIACFLQYIILYDDGPYATEPLIVFIKAFWVCVCFTKVTLDCVSGTILNAAVSFLRLRV